MYIISNIYYFKYHMLCRPERAIDGQGSLKTNTPTFSKIVIGNY